jgi:hypothetical protein
MSAPVLSEDGILRNFTAEDFTAFSGGSAPVVPATGATAGIPGTWTPSGSTPPATVAALQGGSVTASPATAWTTGQFVQTGTAGAAGRATWTGTGWVGGVAP